MNILQDYASVCKGQTSFYYDLQEYFYICLKESVLNIY